MTQQILLNAPLIPDEYREKFFPAVYFLQERKEYLFELADANELKINGVLFKPLFQGKDGGNIFRVCIENSLGLSCLQPLRSGNPVGDPLWVEVFSSKFPSPSAHFEFYQTLVQDLFRQSANLPFDFSDITQRGVSESLQLPTPLFTYFFLKKNAEFFKAAIEIVLADPYRLLRDYPDQVYLHQVSEVDADVILSILQSPETWIESSDFALSRMLQVDGIKYAPERVWQRCPEETYDCPENRFVLHFLRQVLISVDSFKAQRWWKYVCDLPETKLILELATILRQTITNTMFADVGDLYYVPANSQVLMRREGYRDLWALMQKFNSSSRPLFDFWQESIDMRAVHWLYELWVFYKLINIIGESQPCNPCNKVNIITSDDLGVEYGSKAVFLQGQILHYNRTFHPKWKDSFYSYSMVLRPDYFWVDPNSNRKVVLDAKFSMVITEIELDTGSDIDGEQPPTVQEGYPVREDLYKMHTYRDALVGTQAAVILYPGTKSVFMPVHNKRVKDITLEEVLAGKCERVSTDKVTETYILDGIGAIQLRPL